MPRGLTRRAWGRLIASTARSGGAAADRSVRQHSPPFSARAHARHGRAHASAFRPTEQCWRTAHWQPVARAGGAVGAGAWALRGLQARTGSEPQFGIVGARAAGPYRRSHRRTGAHRVTDRDYSAANIHGRGRALAVTRPGGTHRLLSCWRVGDGHLTRPQGRLIQNY